MALIYLPTILISLPPQHTVPSTSVHFPRDSLLLGAGFEGNFDFIAYRILTLQRMFFLNALFTALYRVFRIFTNNMSEKNILANEIVSKCHYLQFRAQVLQRFYSCVMNNTQVRHNSALIDLEGDEMGWCLGSRRDSQPDSKTNESKEYING